ncbi:MAG: cysteine-rich CWC family protein [Acidobacteriota bacterium]
MILKKLAGLITLRWRDPSPCESCNQPFTCGATITGCWCTKIKLSESVRKQLRARYQRCLCQNCLEHYAKTETKPDPTV